MSNKEQLETWLKNCRIALRYWKTVPEKNVYPGLERWIKNSKKPHNCNTVACFGGWVAAMPEFKAKGVDVEPCYGDVRLRRPRMPDLFGASVANELFGDDTLFNPTGNCKFDLNKLPASDHAVVTNRIERRIAVLKEAIKDCG